MFLNGMKKMTDPVSPHHAVKEFEDLYPEAEVETHSVLDEVVVSVKFDPRIMVRKRVLVHNETPSGWIPYKTVFEDTEIKFYLERSDIE